ncbi:hypothetical protein NP568_23515, partial [Vibrio parahaemolyticus]|nr:hypothetical protein [Vibrio parahaemolyticus]
MSRRDLELVVGVLVVLCVWSCWIFVGVGVFVVLVGGFLLLGGVVVVVWCVWVFLGFVVVWCVVLLLVVVCVLVFVFCVVGCCWVFVC